MSLNLLAQQLSELIHEVADELASRGCSGDGLRQRLEVVESRLRVLSALPLELAKTEITIGEVAAAVSAPPMKVLEAAMAAQIRTFHYDGYLSSAEKLWQRLEQRNAWDDVAEIVLDLKPPEIWRLVQSLGESDFQQHEDAGASGVTSSASPKARRFTASESVLPELATESQYRRQTG